MNDLLHTTIPSGMFVTCFYAILDPSSGKLRFANAGHDIPYCLQAGEISELCAVGMPLGLMPGEEYTDHEVTLSQDESILFYTDGLAEAHNPEREMFGFPRLKKLIQDHPQGSELIDSLLEELHNFTGDSWEQEDDVTMVVLTRGEAGR